MRGDAPGPGDPWAPFLAALETGCGTCGGTGGVVREEWRTWYRQADELVRVAQAARRAAEMAPHQDVSYGPVGLGPAEPSIVAAIDRAIDDHMRARPDVPEEAACETCRGTGMILTHTGRRLAEILARHGFFRDR
ncbi:hypothetical protein E1200_06945 [Actinomadura sp. GC306]|uniref:hypothetical protein n=1 Tax=Actinomadura sp. GC306 TaxID=2530367 RepID=UPI00104619A7|nr:hypothetical protein [Actinomadura sp. GC306]TDC69922.1 hypothetical protein E1200_06945 [Actinomadura sp. GC306]